jgi:EmrB/QacA subfamily drug resistance transporter
MTGTELPATSASRERTPWVPMIVLMATTIMVALDGTIVNVALHEIGVSLRVGDGIEWIMTAYLLAVCASQPATGWLSDRFGRKQVLLTCLVAFTGASLLCATATSLQMLIVYRVLQGLGGGAIFPVGMAMALELFPKQQQGRAMATWGMAAMAAPAIGPTLGGFLVTHLGWHWLFLVNLPIGAVTLIAGVRVLPQVGYRERRSFDALGLLFGSIGLSLTVLGLAEGNSWGWQSPGTLVAVLGGCTLLALFVRHERRVTEPLLRLAILSQPIFRNATLATRLINGAQYARLVFMPLQLEGLRGFTPLKVGMLFALPAVMGAVGMGLGGRLVDRIGPRRPIMYGCVGVMVALLAMSQITLDTPVWVIVLLMSVQGICWGATTTPSMVAGIRTLPSPDIAQGTAMRSLGSQMSGAVAIAALGAAVASRMGGDPSPAHAQAAFGWAFVVAALAVVLAMVMAWRLPDRLEIADQTGDEAADHSTGPMAAHPRPGRPVVID